MVLMSAFYRSRRKVRFLLSQKRCFIYLSEEICINLKYINNTNAIFYLSIQKSVLQHRGPKWSILQKAASPWRRGFLLPPRSLSWIHWHLKPNMKTMSLLGDDQYVLNSLIMVMVARLCTCNKNHWIVHFKWINFIICKLYLNKAISKKTNKQKTPWAQLYP